MKIISVKRIRPQPFSSLKDGDRFFTDHCATTYYVVKNNKTFREADGAIVKIKPDEIVFVR